MELTSLPQELLNTVLNRLNIKIISDLLCTCKFFLRYRVNYIDRIIDTNYKLIFRSYNPHLIVDVITEAKAQQLITDSEIFKLVRTFLSCSPEFVPRLVSIIIYPHKKEESLHAAVSLLYLISYLEDEWLSDIVYQLIEKDLCDGLLLLVKERYKVPLYKIKSKRTLTTLLQAGAKFDIEDFVENYSDIDNPYVEYTFPGHLEMLYDTTKEKWTLKQLMILLMNIAEDHTGNISVDFKVRISKRITELLVKSK
jgi:hypothetical protein